MMKVLEQKKEGWFDIADAQARLKVGHSLRDQVTAITEQQKEQGGVGISPTKCNNDTKGFRFQTKASCCVLCTTL